MTNPTGTPQGTHDEVLRAALRQMEGNARFIVLVAHNERWSEQDAALRLAQGFIDILPTIRAALGDAGRVAELEAALRAIRDDCNATTQVIAQAGNNGQPALSKARVRRMFNVIYRRATAALGAPGTPGKEGE